MPYFSPAFADFFRNLAENNKKAWFDDHRDIYEAEVRDPFRRYVEDILPLVQAFLPAAEPDPKRAIFRINRDVRFRKDKTPYKLWVAAAIQPGGRSSERPGFYVQINNTAVMFGGGAYGIQPETLKQMRRYIVDHHGELQEIITDPEFRNTYGDVRGERLTRPPRDLKDHESLPDLAFFKQYYVMVEHPFDLARSNDLFGMTGKHIQTVAPFLHFLDASQGGS